MTPAPHIPVITLDEWQAAGLSYDQYQNDRKRGKLRTLNRGGGSDNKVLIDLNSLKSTRLAVIIKFLGHDPRKKGTGNLVADTVKPDANAREFFAGYMIDDDRYLPEATVKEYTANAEVLNAIGVVLNKITSNRRSRGIATTGIWKTITDNVVDIKNGNDLITLPASQIRLKEKYATYLKGGYETLIHRGFKNTNSKKVTADLERLLLSIASMPTKPYNTTILDLYLQFVSGALRIVDFETGEEFIRKDFFNADGTPIVVSDATVWTYVNNPKNLAILDRVRMGNHRFSSIHRPHVHRVTDVEYSLSKISLDDRDLRKCADGTPVKAYLAFDVKSKACIGVAHSKSKDKILFLDCMRDMFRFLHKNDLGMPLEVEVEQHLANKFTETLLKAGEVFKYVRWCNAGNSQEKYAEAMIKQLKYLHEKKNRAGVGRHYGKRETENNKDFEKVEWTEDGMVTKPNYYTYDEIVADHLFDINEYNNSLHPDQKRYKGMTRLEVFMAYPNPNCSTYSNEVLAKYIGEMVDTSINRSQYVQVRYNKYQLPSPAILSRLQPNNYKVEAYWMPNEENTISEVFLYQNGQFLCKATKIVKFNAAQAEQTDADRAIYKEQTEYVANFDIMTKHGRKQLAKVSILNTDTVTNIIESEVQVHHHEEETPSIDELISRFESENYTTQNRAFDDL